MECTVNDFLAYVSATGSENRKLDDAIKEFKQAMSEIEVVFDPLD